MFTGLVYTELKKLKRTMIPWLIGIGGFLTAGTALLQVSSGSSHVDWGSLAPASLNYINFLALLLVSVFTGYVFTSEYSDGIISILFTYPVSRYRIYAAKHLVIFVLTILLYLVFFLSIMFFGLIYIGRFPAADFLLKLIRLTFLTAAINFVLVPVTALISNLIKGVGTYILVGMGYFVANIVFIDSDYSLFLLPCIPGRLVANYFVSQCMSWEDFRSVVTACTVTFIAAFFAGAVYYSRCDIYK